ncbi:hypothetical protein EGM_11387, partial [Macaca fascicularis]
LPPGPPALAMPMPTEGTPPPLSGTPIPVPAYFRHAEPGFSLKRPRGLSRSLPPPPPAKGSIPISRLFPPRTPGWHQLQPRRVSFRGKVSETLQSPGYDPSRPESFFQQSFQRLSRLGHGSYGEVFKVRSKEDGRLYAVKRSMSPFRGPKDRARKLAEVGSHEKVGQHPCCVRLEQAWEEGGILYLQTELCGPSLQQHCEAWGASLPEAQVFGRLWEALPGTEALATRLRHCPCPPVERLSGQAAWSTLVTTALIIRMVIPGTGQTHHCSPGLGLCPRANPAPFCPHPVPASLGLTILEVACNMELPHGGEGWQQLRQGYLPPEFTAGLSSELRSVLVMMLEPDPKLRATAEALLALPQALLALLCWLWHGLAHPASWLQPPGPPATPPGSPPCSLLLDSSLSSNWDDDSLGPSLSPEAVLARTVGSTSTPRSRCTPRDALDLSDIDSEPPRGSFPSFEPRNLLSLFEDTLDPT